MFRCLMCIILVVALLVFGVPVSGQDGPSITFNLTPYEGNPALPHGEAGAWDEAMWYSKVIYHDGLFHMLYHGYTGADLGIGYATSEDGLTWTRYEGNPVFTSDPVLGKYPGLTGVMVEDDRWVMYVCSVPFIGTTCDALYRATASDPTATWNVDPEPLFEAGEAGDWDYPQLWVNSLIKTDREYVVYYSDQKSTGIGMATSPDGVSWSKYNDPTTTEAKYAHSDPVMPKGALRSWDWSGTSFPCVRQRDDGAWEMFYLGPGAIGYASSVDGITWTRFPDNPVMVVPGKIPYPDALVVVDDMYFLYYTVRPDWDIGVATGTVTWE